MSAVDLRINGQLRPLITEIDYDAMFDFNAPAPITRYRFANGNERLHGHDLDGRLTGTASKGAHGMGLSYDSRNRIETLTNFSNGDWSQTYSYDALDRLTAVGSPGLDDEAYSYDANHNRLSHTRNGLTHTHTIAPTSNRLSAITGPAPRSYDYRPSGEVASLTGPLREDAISVHGFEAGSSTQFDYDPFQRLKRIHGPGIDARYRISALGTRVEKQARGRTTRFVYTPEGQLLAEHDLTRNIRSQHIHLRCVRV